LGLLFDQLLEVGEEAVALGGSLDLMDGLAALHELIEGAYFFGEYLVGDDVVLAEEGVDVADGLHGDDLVSQLVVVLVDVPAWG
jgi:hypothetical protein